jgi:hypothetical protein
MMETAAMTMTAMVAVQGIQNRSKRQAQLLAVWRYLVFCCC